MNRYIAFLRAINVGGHNVKMEHLKSLFEEMGLKSVETFIASGNVIFDTGRKDRVKLESEIEKNLNKNLGYEVITFIRTPEELSNILDFKAFPSEQHDQAEAYNIGFIKKPLNKDQLTTLKSLKTEIDSFNTHKTEVYWLCKTRQSQSTFSGNLIERKLKISITFRGIKTLDKLLKKY